MIGGDVPAPAQLVVICLSGCLSVCLSSSYSPNCPVLGTHESVNNVDKAVACITFDYFLYACNPTLIPCILSFIYLVSSLFSVFPSLETFEFAKNKADIHSVNSLSSSQLYLIFISSFIHPSISVSYIYTRQRTGWIPTIRLDSSMGRGATLEVEVYGWGKIPTLRLESFSNLSMGKIPALRLESFPQISSKGKKKNNVYDSLNKTRLCIILTI